MKSIQLKHGRSVLVALCAVVVVCIVHFTGIFSYLENKTYDSRTVFAADYTQPSDDIIFISVDQASLKWAQKEMNWGWPWPRSALGDVVRYMNIGGAKSIAFDVLFTERSVFGDEDDENLAEACAEYGHVVHAMFGEESDGSDADYPVPCILKTAGVIGSTTSAKDVSDDVMRRARVSFKSGENELPALGLASLVVNGTSLDEIRQNAPVLKDDTLLLRYRKSLEVYHPYRASDVLQSYYDYLEGKEPLIPPESFEGAYVFYAYYAPGLFDICSSPVSQVYPGVGVHITALDNYLSNDFMRTIPTYISILWIVAAAFMGVLSVLFTESRKTSFGSAVAALVSIIVGIGIIVFVSFGLFVLGWYILLIAPLSCFVLAFLSELLLSYMVEGKQKRFIKSAFGQYLSPAVIDKLINDPDSLQLGGEEREISIFFSDVQGFTSISEKLAKTPVKLTEVLNLYLSEMSSIILETGGTIDKYEGDAIIAFWNAPANEPDHASRILNAALKCQVRLADLREKLQELSGSVFYQRIGMNTGRAVVGNMGSRNRFDYTMLGDSVNLASRLEGLNKQFGTYTMCSKATKESAQEHGCDLVFRELARVAVVGKKEAVTVYEPMEASVFESRREIISVFDQGRESFYSGDFERAKSLFDSISDKDNPAKSYAAKCVELMENSPENWQGVWKATQK